MTAASTMVGLRNKATDGFFLLLPTLMLLCNQTLCQTEVQDACNSNPCQSGGSCTLSSAGGFTCNCATGYTGATCTQIDDCASGPCMNGAQCTNMIDGFQCVCSSGFQGELCDTDIDECHNSYPNDCSPYATCSNTIGSYQCACNRGYSGNGTSCEDINECRSSNLNGCSSHATCTNRIGSYQCTCNSGYSGNGVNCEDDIPPTINNCPQSFGVYISVSHMEGVATWTEPTASDVSGVTLISQTSSPGDRFPFGSTRVTYNFRDGLNNMRTCQFYVVVYRVDITCPPPITVLYQGLLSFISPVCTIYRRSSSTISRRLSCSPPSGSMAEEDDVVVCHCKYIRHINCSFQVTVKTKIEECPQSRTISPRSQLSYNVPRCMNSASSLLASCSPPVGFTVNTTDISVTCTCPQDQSVQCNFDIAVDCIALTYTSCENSRVRCDCMEESCDADKGICSSSCTIVNTCPAKIKSIRLSQVNPSSAVEITCILRGSTTILDRLRIKLSSKSDALVTSGIQKVGRSKSKTEVETTFRVNNVTNEHNLYCVLLQQDFLIGEVAVKDFVYVLPVLNAALTSENVSNTTITISWRAWNPTLDDGDPPIVAYIPYYRRVASDEWTNGSRILSNETLQFKAEGLEVDTVYVFSVATVREGDNGEGPRSTPSTVKTFCNVPDVASSVKVGLTSSNRVNVSWQLPPGEMVCSTGVTSYKVYYRIEGSVEKKPELAGTVDDVNTRWFIIDNELLAPGSSYMFFVTVTTDQESEFRQSEPIQAPSGSSAGIIVAVICIIIFLIILVLVILLIIRRKRDMKANQAPRPVDNTYDNVSGSVTKEKWSAGATNATKPAFQMQLAERDDREKISLESFSVDEECSPDEIIYGNLEPPQPIRVAEFKDYFKQNIDKFEQEFSILRGNKKQFDWTVAENPINKKKNRFKNIYTYDHSRVVLKTLPDQEGSDYYNASFIKNASGVKAYIAAQAPNKSSVDDFIRMIWEQNVTTIVMVANLFEEGKERCHQYWPETEGSHKSFGSVTVTWLKTRQFSDFVIRILSFKKGKKTHEVQQLHFLVWPDKDTPEHGTGLIEFVKQSKQIHHGKKYPMLVHCSAGIGRTGTFICLSCMMDVLRDKEFIDVFAFVNKMRENRINMVQTSKQYVFLYKCLNEYHLTHQAEMSVHQMTGLNVDSHRGILLGEFELLSELVQNPTKDADENCTGKMRENIARNRLGNMVPSNRNRVFLMSPGQSNKGNYINASYVKSFQKKDAFITTQSPLPNSIEDFWRMVYDVKSPLIVMLNQLDPTDKTCLQYWPNRGSREYGDMCVTCLATDEQPSSYICRTFDVKHTNSKGVVTVTHMQMKEWQPDINLEGIISLFKDVDIMQRDDQSTQPIIIHCVNGFERSGVMVTVKSEFERLAVTDKIDVFSTVKKLRDQHEHMLKNEDDYILCYHLLKAYLNSNDSNYENF